MRFKGDTTPLWEEPPLPLSYPLPFHQFKGEGTLGFILEDSLYSCKIFVNGVVGWVDKVNIYTL